MRKHGIIVCYTLAAIHLSYAVNFPENHQNTLKLFRHEGTSPTWSALAKHRTRFLSARPDKLVKASLLKSNRILADTSHREDVTLQNLNTLYLANISIGTPPQNFTVLIEASNAQFFIPSEECYSTACRNHRRYNSNSSKTYQKDGASFIIGYNYVSGIVSKDTVCIHDICAEQQPFGEATSENFMMDYNKWDGQLGIGFIADKSMKFASFFSTLMNQGKVPQPIFGMWFSETQGELSLGGVDSRRFSGNISWHSVMSYASGQTWAFQIDEVVAGFPSQKSLIGVVGKIENNLDQTWGPVKDTDKLFMSIGKFKRNIEHWTTYYNDNCTAEFVNSLADISFVLDGKPFSLSGKEYMNTDYEKKYCESSILGVENSEGFWRIGAPFIFKYYIVFDLGQNQIGFANSNNDIMNS